MNIFFRPNKKTKISNKFEELRVQSHDSNFDVMIITHVNLTLAEEF